LGIFETEEVAASKYNEAAAGLGRAENILIESDIPEREKDHRTQVLHNDSDSDSILHMLTTLDSTDDDNSTTRKALIPDIDTITIFQGTYQENILKKKISLGILLQNISKVSMNLKKESVSNNNYWQRGENTSKTPFVWTSLEDFQILTAEKVRLVNELL